MASCHRRLPLQHDLMKLSVRGPNSSLSTEQAKETHTQQHACAQSNSLMQTWCQKHISLFRAYEHEKQKKKKERKRETENREQNAHMSKESFGAAMLRQRQAEMKTAAGSEHIERQRRLEEEKKKTTHTAQGDAGPVLRAEMSASNTLAATSSDMQVLSEQEIPAGKQSHAATSSPGRREKKRKNERKEQRKKQQQEIQPKTV